MSKQAECVKINKIQALKTTSVSIETKTEKILFDSPLKKECIVFINKKVLLAALLPVDWFPNFPGK